VPAASLIRRTGRLSSVIILMFVSVTAELFAQGTVRWNGSTSTDWATAGNWTVVSGTPSTPPAAGDAVELGTAAITNQPTVGAVTTVASLTYGNSTASTLTINANLTITGAITNTIVTTARIHNVSIATGATLSAGSVNLSPAVAAANMTFTFAGTAAFNVSGNFTAQPTTATTTITLTVGTGSFSVGGVTLQGAAAAAARNCVISASTGSLTFSGNYTKHGSGSTLTTSGAATVSFGGNVTNTLGTFTLNAATTTTFTGSGTITPTVAMTFGHVTVNNAITTTTISAAGTLTIAGNLLLSGTAILAGTEAVLLTGVAATIDGTGTLSAALTVSAAHSILATANLTVTGAITMSGTNGDINNSGTITASSINGTVAAATWTQSSAASVLNISGTMLTTGTLTATTAGNTVNYNGTVAQTIKVTSYSNLTISGARTTNNVTIAGAVNIAGVFTLSATFTTGSIVTTGSTINYNGTGAQTVLAINYNNLTVSGARTTNVVTWESTDTVGVLGVLTISATFTSGSHTTTSTIINFNSGGAQNIPASSAFFSYYHLLISNAGTKTAAGNMTVNGDVTIQNAAVFSGGTSRTHALYGNFIVNTSAVTPYTFTTTSILNFNTPTPAAATSISGTTVATLGFNTINMNNTSGFSSTENFNATGTVTVAASVTFTNTTTVSITTSLAGAGAFVNSATGTLNIAGTTTITTLTATAVGNIVNYNGAAQTVKSTSYDILNLSTSGAKLAGGAITVNGNFTLQGTATFNMGNSLTHNFAGNWIINTSAATPITFTTASTVNFNTPGTPAATSISGTTVATLGFNSINMNNTSGFSSTENFNATGTVTVAASVTFTNTTTVSITTSLAGAGTFINTATGTLNIAGTTTITTLTATAIGNIVNYNGAAQTVLATTYDILRMSTSGAKLAGGALTVAGDFTLQGTATFNMGNSLTHNFAGNWIINTTAATPITFTTASTINFNTPGTPAATSISGTTVATLGFNSINMNNTSGFSSTENFNATGTLTIAGSVTFTNTRTVAVTTSLAGAGTFINTATGTLNLAGSISITTLTATAVGNIVNYNGTGSQSVMATGYYNLTISGAHTTNSVTLSPGTISIANTFTASATFTSGGYISTGNMIDFNGTGAQTITAFSYNNLTISGARTTSNVTIAGAVNIAGVFTLSATFTTGSIVTTGSTINYNGTGAQTVLAINYNNLTVSGARTTNVVTWESTDTVGVLGVLTISATFTSGSHTTTSTIINFNSGGAQNIPASSAFFSYYHLLISNAGTKTAAGNMTVNGDVTIQNAAVFSGGTSRTHALYGNFIVNTSAVTPYTFTTTSILNFNTPTPAAATSISGTTVATLGFNTINMNNTSGFSSTENFNATGTVTVAASVTFTNTTTVSITTSLAGAGAFVNSATGTLNIAGTTTITTLTATAVGNIVNYNGAAQTVKSTSYDILNLSTSGAKLAGGAITVNGNFTLQGTATFNMGNSLTHNFAGNWIINTSAATPITFTTASTVNFNTPGTPAATSISGTTVATLGFNSINMNNTSGFSSTENFNATGTVTVAASVTFTNTTTVSITTSLAGAGTFINTATGTLNIAGTTTITTLTATAIGNIVNYNGAAQTVLATTYDILRMSTSGAKLAGGALTVAGDFTLQGTATFNMGNSLTHNFAGNWIINTTAATPITFTTASTINFNTPGTPAATSISGTTVATLGFNSINMNNTSGFSSTENFNVTGTLTVAASVTFNPSVATMRINPLAANGTITGNGTILVTRTAAVPDYSSQYRFTTNTLTNMTVEYNSASPQTISAVNYGNLVSSSTGTRTLAPAGTIGITGTFTPGTNTYTVTSSTVNFNGSTPQSIPAFNFNNLTSSSTGARTLVNGGTIGIASTFTPGSNSYTITGNTIDFNGDAPQTIPAFTYQNVVLTATIAVIKTVNSTVTVNANLTINANNTMSVTGIGIVNIAGIYTVAGTSDNNGIINLGP